MNYKKGYVFVSIIIFLIFLFFSGCSKQSNPITPPSTPVISFLSPVHGIPGATIDINGTGFGSQQGSGYVDFNGTYTSASDIALWSDTKITTKIPATAKTGKLSVFSNNIQSNGMDFTLDTIIPGGPFITNISPSNFAAGDIVTINGANFGNSQMDGYVDFNTARPGVNDYPEWTDNQVKVKAPQMNASGQLFVYHNNTKSNLVDFTVNGIPNITNIVPDSALCGQLVTINGNNFGATRIQGSSYVNFQGYQPLDSDYQSWSNTQIKVLVPQNVVSPCQVKVCAGGNTSNIVILKILQPTPPPSISNISPNPAQPGQSITIIGTNFGSQQGTSYVTIHGIKPTSSNYTSWSDTQIIVNVPANATTGGVMAFVNGKQSNSYVLTIQTSQDNTPVISYIAPTVGQVGAIIAITGSNFGNTQGTSYVSFNGTNAAGSDYIQWTDTKITVKVPVGASSGNIIVYANNKTSNGISFTVQAQNYIVDCVEISTGSFIMGSDTKKADYPEELPAHTVNITKAFYMGKTEITQAVWKTVMSGSNPSKWQNDNNPVDQVSWYDAVNFCNTLSQMVGLNSCYTVNGTNVTCDFTANGFRLPTEAEWEYACRAGTTGDYAADINTIAWTGVNSGYAVHNVATLSANAWGLYDMEGNDWEWCWDWYDPNYYGSLSSTVSEPTGPASSSAGVLKTVRGGSFMDGIVDARCSRRNGAAPDDVQNNRGFRVVRNK